MVSPAYAAGSRHASARAASSRAIRSRKPGSSLDASPDASPPPGTGSLVAAHRKASDSPPTWSSRSPTVYAGQGVGLPSWSSRTPATSSATADVTGPKSMISMSPTTREGRRTHRSADRRDRQGRRPQRPGAHGQTGEALRQVRKRRQQVRRVEGLDRDPQPVAGSDLGRRREDLDVDGRDLAGL